MTRAQRIHFCTTLDHVRIAYAISGQGPPLVKTAHWLNHLEFDWDSPVWEHWLTELSHHYTLIRYDQRGCGLSDWNIADFSLDARVGDLEAVVDRLDLQRFALLGVSNGSLVALLYAARHPERVTHLILYGGYARGRMRRPDAPSREEAAMLRNVMKIGWGRDNPAFRQVYTTLFLPQGNAEQVGWFNDLQRLSTSPENAIRLAEMSWEADLSAQAPRIAVPTLVLHARQDAVVPFEESRTLAALIPGARFVPLESKNHVLLRDEPAWSQFTGALRDFLQPTAALVGGATLADLTRRELEVLELIAQGLDNQEISDRLVLSAKTVSNHITRIFHKLPAANRAQAIVAARDAGLGRGAPPG